jgi:hypothetical protein
MSLRVGEESRVWLAGSSGVQLKRGLVRRAKRGASNGNTNRRGADSPLFVPDQGVPEPARGVAGGLLYRVGQGGG